jgi:hypothetical protein
MTRLIACLALAANLPIYAQTGAATLLGEVVDPQGDVAPGARVTLINPATNVTLTTEATERGVYQFVDVEPARYTIRVELAGFRTSVIEDLVLAVGSATRLNVTLQVGTLAETVNVHADLTLLNTSDAGLGNALSRDQIRSLPVEANNVVHLLSLEPAAVFIPVNLNSSPEDPRYGSVAGARADQQSVSLDGVDANDPQNQTAYTSAVRLTQEALQEFRVSTAGFGSDAGQSSGPQVTLVTRSGANQFRGSGYWTSRRTGTSSNEYFLKLAQLGSGEKSNPPRLDKDLLGGSLGGPIRRDRLFFFVNLEQLRERSETPVTRSVPSDSFRDGVLMYQCEVPTACPGGMVHGFSAAHPVPEGWYGMTPSQIGSIDPLGVGPNLAASSYFRQFPSANAPGLDGQNIMDFLFAAPIQNRFNTGFSRVDYKLRESGLHNLFVRIGKQNDTLADPPQFPGQPPRRRRFFDNYAVAVGYDSMLSERATNSLRWGVTTIDEANVGVTHSNYTVFNFIAPFDGVGDAGTFSNSRRTPTQNVVDDLSWIKGAHTVKIGANLRFARIAKEQFQNSYLSATVNSAWVNGVGRRNMPGSPFCTTPACLALPPVAPEAQAGYADTWLNMIGVLSQALQQVNYDRSGVAQAPGSAVARKFASDEYDFYGQDAWQLGPNLTATAGLRYGLSSPPYEVNGLQVQPSMNMGEWFATRVRNAAAGIPSNRSPIINFDLSGPANHRPGFYSWDWNNLAPRAALAWRSAKGAGENRLVIRGGYAKVYDRIGQGLITNFDEGFAFGLSTTISSPFGEAYESDPSVRFVDPTTLPSNLPAPPPGGFPQTPPLHAGVIAEGIDGTLKTPSAHVITAVVSRDLGRSFAIELGYIARLGRDLLVRRDLAMPLNLVDTRSNTDYFTAARAVITAAQQLGITGTSPAAAYKAIKDVPYWQNLFPAAAGDGLTATQSIARAFMLNGPDWLTALHDMDTACIPACSIFGPYAYFAEQYDSLAAISSVGRSNYNGVVATLRKRYSFGVQFDVNYTLSWSKDMGSEVERGSAFFNFANGGYSGFLVNSFNPESNYGYSDFDVRHQLNTNWLVELPFGNAHRFGGHAGSLANTLSSGWSVAGLWRLTSGFPFNVYNCRSCWATNWNLQGNAMLVDPSRLPGTTTTRDSVDGHPSPFANATDALTYFRQALPGEVGIRNMLRGDGYFTIDLRIAKAFSVGSANHHFQFHWDIFNLTNTPKFDVGQLTMFPDRPGFGRYDGTLATCDGQAGRCMQFGLRYEF